MPMTPATRRFFEAEARALLTRLDRIRPLSAIMPMVNAAALSPAAQRGIDGYLARGRRELRLLVLAYLRWLASADGRAAKPVEAQRRFVIVRLRFHLVLAQFDIFADAVTQRSEHGYGLWLAGLDALARDALRLRDAVYEPPPLLTYLDRGAGAAIRRARTRLPGGGKNPVSIIRVPRERMIGSGIGSSLVHEVGHQAAALLDLVRSLRLEIKARRAGDPGSADLWLYWERTISEIVADFWSVGRLGIGSTMGLIGVVSLPRPFVFRLKMDDPHPFPWIRVRLSAAIGAALYPHPQWHRLAERWSSLYPLSGLRADKRRMVERLDRHVPELVRQLVEHRPASLHGLSLREALQVEERQPARLAALFERWRGAFDRGPIESPTLAFAVLGQARHDGLLDAEREARLIGKLLEHWALDRALGSGRGASITAQPARLLPAA